MCDEKVSKTSRICLHRLVHELAEPNLLGKLFRIDGTDIPVDHRDDDANWNYDHAEDDYYYRYGCCVVTAANSIPIATVFTPTKKVDEETAMRVTSDALAVETPR
ncbi:transposase [Natronococcus sp. JC468]|nr:transposase [Natronococcus sp. JC468]NKE36547.1 transposase [Natronococcus sp. JC468]